MPISKASVLEKIIAHLSDEIELYARAARAAHAEATHEQSRAENKYDTRGLEASYLARGQSRQAAELEKALEEFRALSPRAWDTAAPISVGALVELVRGKERSWFFVGPRAGGIEVQQGGTEVTVLTPQSPLGRQLMGRKVGDRLSVELTGSKQDQRVASVL